jgi:glucose/arabinose dehydrogenase
MLRHPLAVGALALGLLSGCSSGGTAVARVTPTVSTLVPTTEPATPSAVPTVTPTYPPVRLKELGSFTSPVWAGPAPGDPQHLFLVEKPGRLLQLDADGRQQSVVLDLTQLVSKGNEQGFLSMAFDPSYASNHRLYVDYTGLDGNSHVEAYTVNGGVATNPEVLFTVHQPYANHNGGLLLFDPTGMLLVGLGDGGSAGDPDNTAQNLTSDLGKILRIDPRTGTGAPGNPYPQNPRVWALGLRNPWRFSFDTNGDLYLGDVGQNKLEELDVVKPADQLGANYGWSVYEGNERFKPKESFSTRGSLITPALTYLHSDGGCSITGGEVYHARTLPFLDGRYVFGDYCAGKLWAVTRTPTGVTPLAGLGVKVDGLQAFGRDLHGELLVLSADKLYRLIPG